jgi:cytochrome c biogenesis protein CcmG/thiol:disulfide interchange protein DsbE
MSSKRRLRPSHVGLGLTVAVTALVAMLAIVLPGHRQTDSPASQTRPAHHQPAPSGANGSSAIMTALVRGAHPLAPDAAMPLPVLGSSSTRTLHSFRGKVVVLNVFASWCAACQTEAPILEQAQQDLGGQPATVLGVTYEDNPANARGYVRARHITYPVLRDVTGHFVRSYHDDAVPETFVIDQHGRIIAARAGEITSRWLTQALARVLPGSSISPPPATLPPTASELAAMTQAYPVLGRAQQANDLPPSGTMDANTLDRGGRRANSRRALVTSRGEALYIVPARQSICFVSSDNVINGCQPFPYTTTTPADITATLCAPNLPSSEIEVAGLMAPNASDIKVHYSDGSTRPLTAVNGMIAIYAPIKGPLPKTIIWTSPDGPEHTGTAVPPNAASTRCGS